MSSSASERGASAGELRAAFREAAKTHHPDRPGGDAVRFRAVVEAYHVLQRPQDGPAAPPPRNPGSHRPAPSARPHPLVISPERSVSGGDVEQLTPDGRRMRISLPPGLRAGDRLRAGGVEFEVVIRGDGGLVVRGDDLWISVGVDAKLLAKGGRIAVDTPLGRRVVFITKKAGESGLVRLQGQGLPARGRHRQGHLFLRLSPLEPGARGARGLFRRFNAWAA